jgi:hydrogenase maturation factor
MCLSRIHRVVGAVEGGRVTVLDLDGHERSISLLAYDGLAPKPGDWLVAHSGYALATVEPEEAEAVLSELRALEKPTTP